MLDIAKLSSRAAGYYLREASLTNEAYYSESGAASGQWRGHAASELGLSGNVGEEQFHHLFAGRDPRTGALLGQRHRRNAVPAFDLVFRPTKSVSIAWGLAEPDAAREIAAAHHAAVDSAVDYLERRVGTRRGTNGRERMEAGGFLAARYDHSSSRAGDPLLHSHLIVANRVRGTDDRWSTLDARDLYGYATAADALYRAEYQARLSRKLGIRWTDSTDAGNREIVGIPDKLIRQFSKRRETLDLVREARLKDGLDWNERIAQGEAIRTRPEKRYAPPSVLQDEWRQQARAAGYLPSAFLHDAMQPGRDVPPDIDVSLSIDALLQPDGLCRHRSTFTAADVIRALGARVGNITAADLEDAASTLLRDQRVVGAVAPSDYQRTGARYTTLEMLEVERRLVDSAVARSERRIAVAAPRMVSSAIAEQASLSEDQIAAVRTITGDGAGVSTLVGPPGSGKTFALRAARVAWEKSKVEVLGCAPTGVAAEALAHGTGVHTMTIESLLLQLDSHRMKLPRGSVLIVDEAGMVGTRTLTRLHDHAIARQAKLVLVGDHRQLQAIDAGGGFRALLRRLGGAELTQNHRQRSRVDREALELIRAGRGDAALDLYDKAERLTILPTPDALRSRLVGDWWKYFSTGADAVMLTHRRDEAHALNAAARSMLAAEGRLGTDVHRIGELDFRVGDMVVCRINDRRRVGVVNGTRGQVTSIDPMQDLMTVKVLGEDRSVFITRAYIRRADRYGVPAVEHAYALTAHRVQGLTVDHAFVDMGGARSSEWAYVALSRARETTHLYAVDQPHRTRDDVDIVGQLRPDVRTALAKAMSRDDAGDLAIDGGSAPLKELTLRELWGERVTLIQKANQLPPSRRTSIDDAEQRHARLVNMQQQADADLQRLDGSRGRRALGGNAARRVDEARQRALELRAEVQRSQRTIEMLRREHALHETAMERTGLPAAKRLAAVERELGKRSELGARRLELDTPVFVERLIGRPNPAERSPAELDAWRDAAREIDQYREQFGADELKRALDGAALSNVEQVRAHRRLRAAMERLNGLRVARERKLG